MKKEVKKEEIDENVFDNDGKDVEDEYKLLFGEVNEIPKESPWFNDIHNTSFGEPEKPKKVEKKEEKPVQQKVIIPPAPKEVVKIEETLLP